jgi:hypothetical protein
MTWFPPTPGLDQWLDLYHRVARSAGGEPDAGRRLRSWAKAAGFTAITSSAGAWCYATAEERAWWSELWADRTTNSSYADQATAGGHATADELAAIAEAWRRWGASDDAWFAVLHGEILATA